MTSSDAAAQAPPPPLLSSNVQSSPSAFGNLRKNTLRYTRSSYHSVTKSTNFWGGLKICSPMSQMVMLATACRCSNMLTSSLFLRFGRREENVLLKL